MIERKIHKSSIKQCYWSFSFSLETSGRLMELNHKTGKLHVNYGDRLVTLMREVRQLGSMGFAVPAKIQHVSNTAQKFYRHGVILKQVGMKFGCFTLWQTKGHLKRLHLIYKHFLTRFLTEKSGEKGW